MSDIPPPVLVGNYLSPEGTPCIATQNNALEPNIIGGSAVALGWLSRWIAAASPEVAGVFVTASGTLTWGHRGTHFNLAPGQWVVWDGSTFRTVAPATFAATYDPVPVTLGAP